MTQPSRKVPLRLRHRLSLPPVPTLALHWHWHLAAAGAVRSRYCRVAAAAPITSTFSKRVHFRSPRTWPHTCSPATTPSSPPLNTPAFSLSSPSTTSLSKRQGSFLHPSRLQLDLSLVPRTNSEGHGLVRERASCNGAQRGSQVLRLQLGQYLSYISRHSCRA